ncbi:MAG: type II toxin-antitoxin system prevent-host-death family antitoxin [Gammaproteobacteria bacterium]|nr:type II toxin-antitoxin system prevent-host-death family antitoxin [Gammaproteobacteria bacterium]MCY4345112.1 type II toxin-antitoxin system prevent-host-death family antitoxin [Gammaproteobacteria bacterium]
MQFVGSYQAKTRLPELLRQVERGERFTITRRGLPIARIIGVEENVEDTQSVIDRIRTSRARRPPISVEELIAARDEGRKS